MVEADEIQKGLVVEPVEPIIRTKDVEELKTTNQENLNNSSEVNSNGLNVANSSQSESSTWSARNVLAVPPVRPVVQGFVDDEYARPGKRAHNSTIPISTIPPRQSIPLQPNILPQQNYRPPQFQQSQQHHHHQLQGPPPTLPYQQSIQKQPQQQSPQVQPMPLPTFPSLAPVPSDINQTVQSPAQIRSIISLPVPLLLSLAKAHNVRDQKLIANAAKAQNYLPSMAIPPPSQTQIIGDHPSVPILLGQVFTPPSTPGVMAPLDSTIINGSTVFEPLFASVEDWSREEISKRLLNNSNQNGIASSTTRPGLVTTPSFDAREAELMKNQLKAWATQKQAEDVHNQVIVSQEKAILLASHAAVRQAIKFEARSITEKVDIRDLNAIQNPQFKIAQVVLSGGEMANRKMEEQVTRIDLNPYAVTFRAQMENMASSYFSQLHKEAYDKLMQAAESPTPPSNSYVPSNVHQNSSSSTSTLLSPTEAAARAQAFLVASAATAAVISNVLAANQLATEAAAELRLMGIDPNRLIPNRPKTGLLSLLAKPSDLPRKTILAPPALPPLITNDNSSLKLQENVMPSIDNSGLPNEVVSLIKEAKKRPEEFTPQKRDFLLGYAHTLYTTDSKNLTLLPLLYTIHTHHPDHLPTLLLISCVYFSRQELQKSLEFNAQILSIDPNYIEAISNIGTTMRALGNWQEAEKCWTKAINLRPTYWDAVENLLGVLCSSPVAQIPPRLSEALRLCEVIEWQIYKPPSPLNALDAQNDLLPSPSSQSIPRPRILPITIPSPQVHRLQNLFYAKGNLKLTNTSGGPKAAKDEFEKAVECALSLPVWAKVIESNLIYPFEGCTTRDLIIAITVVSMIISASIANGNSSHPNVTRLAIELGITSIISTGNFGQVLDFVHRGGDEYVKKIVKMGNGNLPTILLLPDVIPRLLSMLFAQFGNNLPSLLDPSTVEVTSEFKAKIINSTNQTTSTMLLTIAKTIQDSLALPETALSFDGIIPSPSLLLPLYYLALSLHPSPSTFNNLGILLSTLNASLTIFQPTTPPMTKSAQLLALDYYQAGLNLDPRHPHLYTNLGSLLKDLGQLPQAVLMYQKAVKYNPDFDVALANLANAIKDAGSIQDAIPYYRRAVELNENFPEAVCGLVNALSGVCDWVGRGGTAEDFIVDNTGLLQPPLGEKSGYIGNISNLIAKQLFEGSRSYGIGAVKTAGSIGDWLEIISQAIYGVAAVEIGSVADVWRSRLEFFMTNYDRTSVNEGGFIIRLIERLMRRVQRRWYSNLYGVTLSTSSNLQYPTLIVSEEDKLTYKRPILPITLSPPPVPTVLPFHTFTYPVTARETRLISHRTGLRISHSTLNQPWLPSHVYPPPPPPASKINVGYVSSDFGNHPLSHLMQSVFGFHNLNQFNIFCYATSTSDNSPYRLKIESECQNFLDASSYSTQQLVDKIVGDGIHILINLAGYTRGAKNEVFAARPAPIQMSYMGFAGGLASGWSDYFIVDPVVCPPALVSGTYWRAKHGLLNGSNPQENQVDDSPTDFEGDPDPEDPSEEFVYTEKLIYLPHSYFVTDHKQAWREDEKFSLLPGEVGLIQDGTKETSFAIEEDKRWRLRKRIFPLIRDDAFIFANWNQLYKIDPYIFRTWLEILKQHDNSILWLLRFPAPGEAHLRQTAIRWMGKEIADRIVFTDVVNKFEHIARGRIPDLFLDTTECNAHTTAADILWSGTPILTFPRYKHKLCSRVATSIALATGFGSEMIVSSAEEYTHRALFFASSLSYDFIPAKQGAKETEVEGRIQRRSRGALSELRKKLFLNREEMPLFDTKRWVKNMEKGLTQAWSNWVLGKEFEDSAEFQEENHPGDSCIWIEDDQDGLNPSRGEYTI